MDKTSIKALPSQPIWTQTSLDFGFWNAGRQKLYELMAIYQHNDVVHGCININANGIVAAKPALMRVVNEGAKNLSPRKLKRLTKLRSKRLAKQWHTLNRKSLGDEQELVEVESHPFWDALNSLDNDISFEDLLKLTVVNIYTTGVAFWQRIKDGVGRITSYKYLPSYNVSPDRAVDGTIQGWFYASQFGDIIKKQPIPKEDMVIFREPSPTDPHASGDSRLLAALTKLELSGQWTDWQKWLVGNRARPDWLFIPKMPDGATLNQDQVERQEKKLNDKYRGPGNGRIGVMEQAGSAIPLNFTPTDMAPLQFNEELRKAVLFVLGIPEAFSNNDGNRANLEGSLEQWARQSLAPLVCVLEPVLNREAALWDSNLVFCFENVIPEDEAFELQEQTFDLQKWSIGLQYGGIDNDEYRVNVLGLDPKEESELYEEKEPAAAAAAAPLVPQEEPEADTEAEDTEDIQPEADKSLDLLALNNQVARGELDRATAINLIAFALSLPDEEAKKLVTHPVAKACSHVKGPQPVVKLKEPELVGLSEFAKTISMQMERQKLHYLTELQGFKSAEGIETKSIDALPAKFTALDEWDKEDQFNYKPYLQAQMIETAEGRQKALLKLGAEEGSFSVIPQNIEKAVNKSSLKFAQSTNSTTAQKINDALDQLREELKAGLESGDSIQVMKSKIQDIFENIEADRAETIAHTELSRATHSAQKMTAKASGIVSKLKWLTSDETCDECLEYDGKEVPLNEPFEDGEGYDLIEYPPLHPNCRCTMTEVLDL